MMDQIDKDFIAYFHNTGKSFALGDMPSTLIAILYIDPEPVAMEEIAKRTGYSLATISNMMKMMENMGFVRRIKKPKTRKVYFYMEKDIVKLNKQKLVIAYENGVKPAILALPGIINKYKDKALDERTQRKVEIVRDYFRQMVEFEKIIKHMIEDLDQISAGKSGSPLRAYKP
jgi:DNA-binding transcriptional regulator GbsR (MarR family)